MNWTIVGNTCVAAILAIALYGVFTEHAKRKQQAVPKYQCVLIAEPAK